MRPCRLLTLFVCLSAFLPAIARSQVAAPPPVQDVKPPALQIIDDAIQAHGGGGVSDDFGLAKMYAGQRTLRLADGPDEVHARAISRIELAKHSAAATDAGFSSGDIGVSR